MEEVKIFIASSSNAIEEAQTLATKLGKNKLQGITLKPIRWWAGADYSHILSNLIRETNECDFAVILLTEDDLVEKNGEQAFSPRDNCIFEAGLFAGALGPDFERCRLMISFDPRRLPSDLGGLRYIDILEYNKPGIKKEDVDSKIEEAAGLIAESIDHYRQNKLLGGNWGLRANRGLKLPLITVEEMIGLERLQSEGGNLFENSANVFVSSLQPVEMINKDFARQVISNMVKGGVEYRYVFQADLKNTGVIASVMESLIGVDSLNGATRSPKDNLKILNDYLRFYFLPDRPGFRFCVHNAHLYDSAVCYLRSPIKSYDGEIQFVEWCKGDEAVHMAHEITRMCKDPPRENKCVLRSTVHYDLYAETTKDQFQLPLEEKIIDKLGILHSSLKVVDTFDVNKKLTTSYRSH